MSLIAASQLILVPDMPTSLTSLYMLSPDSRCYSQVIQPNQGIQVLTESSDLMTEPTATRGVKAFALWP